MRNTEVVPAQNRYRDNGFAASLEPAEDTEAAPHGGDCIAIRRYINPRPIPQYIVAAAVEHHMTKLRTAGRIVRQESRCSIPYIALLGLRRVLKEKSHHIEAASSNNCDAKAPLRNCQGFQYHSW